MWDQSNQNITTGSCGTEAGKEIAPQNFSTLLETFETLVNAMVGSQPESFQRLFVHLVVFIAIDLEQGVKQLECTKHDQCVRILEAGINAVSRRYVAGDLRPAAINREIAPLLLSAVNVLRGDRVEQTALDQIDERWRALGINVDIHNLK